MVLQRDVAAKEDMLKKVFALESNLKTRLRKMQAFAAQKEAELAQREQQAELRENEVKVDVYKEAQEMMQHISTLPAADAKKTRNALWLRWHPGEHKFLLSMSHEHNILNSGGTKLYTAAC